MIEFELDEDHSHDGARAVYWLGLTHITGEDEEHIDEIYEQLDAELAFNL